jgi:hypothetical protein
MQNVDGQQSMDPQIAQIWMRQAADESRETTDEAKRSAAYGR